MAEHDRYQGDEIVPVEVDAPFTLRHKEPKHGRTLTEKMVLAGWTDDPMDGKAFHDQFGREIVNPLSLAPPVGYTPEPTVMELIERQLALRLQQLAGTDEVDSLEEADDFDLEEEWDPTSLYEIRELLPESPRLPPSGGSSEKVEAVASTAGGDTPPGE